MMSTFPGKFCLDEVKKVMPKIKIPNVPNGTIEEVLVTKIYDKDAYHNTEINNDATFSVVKS